MKKILLASILLSVCSFASSQEVAYLTDGSGSVVKSGFGLCWNTSGIKIPNTECGDLLPGKTEVIIQEKPVAVVKERKRIKMSHHLVVKSSSLFEFDSDVLSAEGKNIWFENTIGINPLSVEIIGHTDQLGTVTYNLELSNRRAEAVKKFLVEQGIKSENIKALGVGESNPLCVEKKLQKNSPCSVQNRRVEITTEYLVE